MKFKNDIVNSNMDVINCDQCDKVIDYGETYYYDPNEEFSPIFCSKLCVTQFYCDFDNS